MEMKTHLIKHSSDPSYSSKQEITTPLFGLDIGGTLTKCVYFEPIHCLERVEDVKNMTKFIKLQKQYNLKLADHDRGDSKYEIKIREMNGYVHFLKFQTEDFPDGLSLISEQGYDPSAFLVAASGGGAYKYEKKLSEVLKKPCPKSDELQSLIRGMSFLQVHYPNECYTFIPTEEGPRKVVIPMKENVYPFLLVNIGSGVSILRVTSDNLCERVGGCPLGGGTFFGLARLLTGELSFEEALKQAGEGNKSNVDMLVKDIYGGDYTQFNLKGSVVASSFGKLGRQHIPSQYSSADVLASILHMITNNIGSLANLYAKNYGIKRIIYSGNFFHHNETAMHLLSMSMRYWSAGSVKALFLEHEGYCGAVGAMLSLLMDREFTVIPNATIDDDDKNSVDIDPTASVEEIKDFVWVSDATTVTISITDPKLLTIPYNGIKVESSKQSLFVQVHIIQESILTLRIPVLFDQILPEQTCFSLEEAMLIIILTKKEEKIWPRLNFFYEGSPRTTRSCSC